MSARLHSSLSGSRSHPTLPHQQQKQGPVEANLKELGLLGDKYTRRNAKRTVEFTAPGDHTHSTCSLRLV